MSKISKKILFILIALTLVFSIFTNVFASDITPPDVNTDTESENTETSTTGTTTLEIVEDNVCTIEVDDLARFEKRITAFDETEKSATLTLSLTNLKTVEERNINVEIFLVIDNSASMTTAYVGDKTRKQAVLDSASSLVDKIYAQNNKAQVGVVGFSSLDTTAGQTEGTINDATLITRLSNNSNDVKNAISNLSSLNVGPRTNIDAGVTVARDNFSSNENVRRYIILLTDGVPNNDINGHFLDYSDTVLLGTKSKLESIEASGISIISAMINLNDTTEPTTGRTYRELAETVFGTESNPTTSTYFYIDDTQIEDTIINDIFDSLVITTDNTLRNITITDYFPQEIIDNFNFEYVASPNIGEVSQTINTQNNSITWNIELLSEGETATLSYKLTLKDDYNKDIIDIILKTNDHVDITGEDSNGPVNESSDVSPTIRVEYEEPTIIPEPEPEPEPKPEPEPEPDPIIPEPEEPDNTVAPDPIPQTGDILFLIFIITFITLAIISATRYIRITKLGR